MALFINPLLAVLLTLLLILLPLFLYRIHSVLPSNRKCPTPRRRGSPTHVLIVLGSGGHTAEMLSMLRTSISSGLNWQDYTYRTWVTSSGDTVSSDLAERFEREMSNDRDKGKENQAYRIMQVTRARKIHQSLLTTPLSCLHCLWDCLAVLLVCPGATTETTSPYPDLVLTNGPATATILIFGTLLLRFLGLEGRNGQGQMRTVYVESWARVKRMSLSGRILAFWVDRCLVQWEGLRGKGFGGRGEFRGSMVG